MDLAHSSNRPTSALPPQNEVTIHPQVLDLLPDPGAFLLDLIPEGDLRSAATAELDRVRYPTGGYDLSGVAPSNWHQGPLCLIWWAKVVELTELLDWATDDLLRDDRHALRVPTVILLADRGLPYAASWAQQARPCVRARPQPWPLLAQRLEDGYQLWAKRVTHKMVINSFRMWLR